MNHKAIYALYPNAVSIKDDQGAFDVSGNKIELDMAAIDAWVDPDAYKQQRVAEYPSISDQLDALFHAGVFPEAMAAQIQAVKDKYPKA